jgi:hypothetical protein
MPNTIPTTPPTPDHTNRHMAAELRRLGFKKAELQLARNATTYQHPDAPGVLCSYAKHSRRVMVTGLGQWFPGVRAALGFRSGPALWAVPNINEPSEAAARSGFGIDAEGNATQREVLLRVARALAAQGGEE